MPDITLLPEIAQMYGVTVEDILTAGSLKNEKDFKEIAGTLNYFVSDKIFDWVLKEFENAGNVCELTIPMDFFMALNIKQKDTLLKRLMVMDGYGTVIDDILPYLNMSQRAFLIKRVALNEDYQILETLIPFMTRTVRTEIVLLLLERRKFDFLEDMIMFLNQEQREIIFRYITENGLDFEQLDSLMPYLEQIIKKYENRRNLNE